MFEKQLEQELKKYKKTEKIIFLLDVVISTIIIFFSQKIIRTSLGQAAIWMTLILLGIIIILKTFKILGPKN